ncbi:hypothetical protein D3C85_1502520 [compost metagenome]
MHRQRFADVAVEQAVVRIRQAAVGLEPDRLAGRHDRRQPRMLGNDKAPPQSFMHQPHSRHRPEAVVIQAQQSHRATVEVFAQGLDQSLQPHGIRQLDNQVGRQAFTQHGSKYPLWLDSP